MSRERQSTTTNPPPGLPAVEYWEDAERSPVYSLANGQSRVERIYYLRHKDLEPFAATMLGYPRIAVSTAYALATDPKYNKRKHYITRALPHATIYPHDVGQKFPDDVSERELDTNPVWLWATALTRVEPLEPTGFYSADTDSPGYKMVRATVLYEPTTFKIRSDAELRDDAVYSEARWEWDPVEIHLRRYVTKTTRHTIEYLALPRGRMQWVVTAPRLDATIHSIGKNVDYATAVPVPSQEIVYTWHQVPFIPQALRTHLGCVNLKAFKDHNRVYPPGTLLLLGAEVKPYRMGSGKFVLDITYRIKYYDPFRDGRGHNYFLRFSNKATNPTAVATSNMLFMKITHNGNEDVLDPTQTDPGQPIFPYADFQELFAWKCARASDRGNARPATGTGVIPDQFEDEIDDVAGAIVAAPDDVIS